MDNLHFPFSSFFFFFSLLLTFNLSRVISASSGDISAAGKRWAILVSGSNGFSNYRHQADVCHAYQILKDGGLDDENIVVFMYDDIAYSTENPRPGTIINSPNGSDVYNGVPKDYVGEDVTVSNFLAVLLANKTAIKGGSGKVVDSGPKDSIFIYYTDHGGPGVLAFPVNPMLYAGDLIKALKKKHASRTYKSMVVYVEACESGSIMDGLLPHDINVYATTAANSTEDSFATYCPHSGAPPEFDVCLGDMYSIAWLEDSDRADTKTETLEKQYEVIKKRTTDSHVMQYGQLALDRNHLSVYIGSTNHDEAINDGEEASSSPQLTAMNINQWDADLVYFKNKIMRSAKGSSERIASEKELFDSISHRDHVDSSIHRVGQLLFGAEKASQEVNAVRSKGQPLVDDWDCLKSLVRAFETHCGSLSRYGMKHMRVFANICNAGKAAPEMAAAAAVACPKFPSNPLSSLSKGFSA